MLECLKFLYLFEIFVRKIEEDYSQNNSADGGISVGAESPSVYVVQRVPDSPPNQNQRQDDGKVSDKISKKFSCGHNLIITD